MASRTNESPYSWSTVMTGAGPPAPHRSDPTRSDRSGPPPRAEPAPRRRERDTTAGIGIIGLSGIGVLGAVVTNVLLATDRGDSPLLAVLPNSEVLLLVVCGFLIHRPYAEAAIGLRRSPRTLAVLIERGVVMLPIWWTALVVRVLMVGPPPSFDRIDWILTALLLIAPFESLRSAVIPPGWILSAAWILALLVPLWNPLVRRARRRLRHPPSAGVSQLIGIFALLVGAAVAPALRIFVPALVGAMASVLCLGRPDSRPRRFSDGLGSLAVAAAVTIAAWILLIVVDPGPVGSTTDRITDRPSTLLLWTAVALSWILLVASGENRGRPFFSGTRSFGGAASLLIGVLVWHDPVLRLLIEATGVDIRLASAVHLSLVGGILAALASHVLVYESIRRFLLRLPVGADLTLSGRHRSDTPSIHRPRPSPATAPWARIIDLLRILSVIALLALDTTLVTNPSRPPAVGFGSLAVLAAVTLVSTSAFRLHQAVLVPTIGRSHVGAMEASPRPHRVGPTLRRLTRTLGLYWVVLTIAFVRGDLAHVRGVGAHLQLIVASPVPDPAVLRVGGIPVVSIVLLAELWTTVIVGLHARWAATLLGRGLGTGAALTIPSTLLLALAGADRSGDGFVLTVALWSGLGIALSALAIRRRARRRPPPLLDLLPTASIILLPLAVFVLVTSGPRPSPSPVAIGRMPTASLSATAAVALLLLIVIFRPPSILRRSTPGSGGRSPGVPALGVLAWYPTMLLLLKQPLGSESVLLGFVAFVTSAAAAFTGVRIGELVVEPVSEYVERRSR